uniref:Uncharacterized protein n=1 Tax=Micrurus lemniscatus lemniscatus TaxID=129467 RepID=A0A2D4JGZ0_MICLE
MSWQGIYRMSQHGTTNITLKVHPFLMSVGTEKDWAFGCMDAAFNISTFPPTIPRGDLSKLDFEGSWELRLPCEATVHFVKLGLLCECLSCGFENLEWFCV